MPSSRPFDDIRALIGQTPKPDEAARAAEREREAELTKPAGSLGSWRLPSPAVMSREGRPEKHEPAASGIMDRLRSREPKRSRARPIVSRQLAPAAAQSPAPPFQRRYGFHRRFAD